MAGRKSGGSGSRGSGSRPSGRKSGLFKREEIQRFAADKPVVYKLLNARGKNLYTGSAKRGRVRERLEEHLPDSRDPVTGAKRVQILQKASIDEARKAESRIISRERPPQNERGK